MLVAFGSSGGLETRLKFWNWKEVRKPEQKHPNFAQAFLKLTGIVPSPHFFQFFNFMSFVFGSPGGLETGLKF